MALLLVLESSPAMAGRSHTSRRHKQDRDKKEAMDESEQPSKDKTVARVEVRTAPVSKVKIDVVMMSCLGGSVCTLCFTLCLLYSER